MKILLAIPTEVEIHEEYWKYLKQNYDVELLITGIGIAQTTFSLTHYLCRHHVNMMIHAGICGTFRQNFNLGDVVFVESDTFADFGVIENHDFIHASKIFHVPLWYHASQNIPIKLPRVRGVTVNSLTASSEKANLLINTFNPDIETMENAAAIFVSQKFEVPILTVRSISNYVGERNKQNWNIDLAIKNLWLILKKIINVAHG
ncbi:MAG: hypothetical protein N2449_07845 [Bacteroidales bacterium]|nr:hypothetical protein [Bacteroidales bacterium]